MTKTKSNAPGVLIDLEPDSGPFNALRHDVTYAFDGEVWRCDDAECIHCSLEEATLPTLYTTSGRRRCVNHGELTVLEISTTLHYTFEVGLTHWAAETVDHGIVLVRAGTAAGELARLVDALVQAGGCDE